jgi:photosynthetic reaction center cytochrome c subunit
MKSIVLKMAAVSLALSALLVLLTNRSSANASLAPQEKTVEQVQKNIKVLNGMPQSQLIPVMNFIAASLGRRCNFCHVNRSGQWDYASDEKTEKNTAREMIKMVLDLHKQKFPGAEEISCYTCHRGQSHPTSFPPLPLPLPSPRPAAPGGAGAGSASPSATPQPSPSATPALPTAEAIFSKYIQAIGGQANVDKIKTRSVKGSVSQPTGPVPFESLQAAPDKFHIMATVGQATFERGFNGSLGWEKSARGVRQLSPSEISGLQGTLGLVRHIRLKEQFKSTRVRPAEKIGDRPVVMVIGTTLDDRQERLYFDAETGLLMRRVSYLPTLIGLIPEQLDFADYRDVDGVKFPFLITLSSIEVGNPVSTRTISEIKLNPIVDDAKFNMPPAAAPNP